MFLKNDLFFSLSGFKSTKILNWNLLYNYINVFYNLANLKLNLICSWFYNFFTTQVNWILLLIFYYSVCKIVGIALIWLYIYISIIFFIIIYFFNYKSTCYKFFLLIIIFIIFIEPTCATSALQTGHISPTHLSCRKRLSAQWR